jgi:3-oxoadipate enol-lactonase
VPLARGAVDLYYVDEGGGADTLMFCHGAGGNSTSWWRQIPAFARHYRCIAFDHRAFGRSRCAPEAFAVEAFAEDAVAVLDAAGVERAHFVCQSMGGWTGIQVALRHPERIRSLVLADTIGGLALPSGLESVRGAGARAEAAGAVHQALAADYPSADPAGTFLYLQLSAFNSDLGRIDLFRRLFAPEVLVPLDRARDIRIPALVIAGTKDLIWPPEVLRELSGHLPDARVVEIEAGHSAYFEAPDAFNEALRRFLER